MIAIIDYGVGNLFSLSSSLAHLGLETVITSDADTLRAADQIILPGVGAFADAAAKLRQTGLVEVIYASLDGKIYFSANRQLAVGEFYTVKIEEAVDYDLVGRVVSKAK